MKISSILSYPSFCCLVLVINVVGCTSELSGGSNSSGPGPDDLVPLSVQTNLDATVSPGGGSTRANVPTGGSIGVFCTSANGYPPQDNIQYTTSNGSSWSSATPIYLDSRTAELWAYYPYGETTLSGSTATLTAQAYSATEDLCYAKTGGENVCNKNPDVTFSMEHVYSRVKVNIQRTNKYSEFHGPCEITGVRLACDGDKTYFTRTLDLVTGALDGSLSTAPWIDVHIPTIAIGSTDMTTDLLFPPQNIGSSGASLYITVDGVVCSVIIPQNKFTGNELSSGRMYTISVKVEGLPILVLDNTTIEDGGWGTIPGSSNGSLTEVQPPA